jgi:hypothetical protein
MKYLFALLALAFAITAVPTPAVAKDKDRDKSYKDIKNDYNLLEGHYNIVKDRVKNMNGDRRNWQDLHDIRANIDRIGDMISNGGDYREIRGRIQQSQNDLNRVQADLDYKNSRGGGSRGGFYSR